jgi:drug/metabolite transporter (DMT)-like permease
MRERRGPVALLILACLSWGLSTALSKIALRQLTSTDLFGIEIVVAAVPLAAIALARGARPGRPDPLLLLLGILEPGLTYLLFDIGVRRTSGSHAALLLALDTPATLLLAVAFLRERVDAALLLALGVGVAGSVLVTWNGTGSGATLTGDVLVIASALTAACYGVLARHVAGARDPLIVTTVQVFGALLIAAPILGYSLARGSSRIGSADAGHLAIAVAVALTGSVIPFLLFNRAIKQLTASRAALISVLIPVVAAGLTVPLLGEHLTGLALAGGSLSIAAALVAAQRPDNARPRPPRDAPGSLPPMREPSSPERMPVEAVPRGKSP